MRVKGKKRTFRTIVAKDAIPVILIAGSLSHEFKLPY